MSTPARDDRDDDPGNHDSIWVEARLLASKPGFLPRTRGSEARLRSQKPGFKN